MDETVWIADVSKLAEGIPVAAQVEGVELVVLKCRGSIGVFQGVCPHQGTLLAAGSVDNGVLTCSGHGWQFDGGSGQKTNDPSVCLKRFSTRIEADRVGVSRMDVHEWKYTAQRQSTPSASASPLLGPSPKRLPGPKGLPLIGNMLQLDVKKLHTILEQWANKYGDVYTFKMATKQVVAIADPDLINNVLRLRPESYRRLSSIAPVFSEMGMNGVFSAEGTDWYRHRRVATHALTASHLRQFYPTLAKVTVRLKGRWDRNAASGLPVDVQKDLMCFTVDVTTNLAFGYDINTLEETGGVLQQHLELIMPMLNRRLLALFPYWRFFKLREDRTLDKALVAVHKVIADLIAQSRTRLLRDPELAAHPTNFLEALLAARDEEAAGFTEDEIAGNVLTMLVAGEDTTANTMTWMIYFMSAYPEIQQRMQREADDVLGSAPMLQNYLDHERLTYLEAVAYETMRLKPVAPLVFLEANHAVELGGMAIPAGTVLALLTRQCALQESAFAAAHQFSPERWLATPGSSQSGRDTRAYVPFGAGPRFCPGRTLALLEVKAAMAMLCHNFSVSNTTDPKQVGEQFSMIMNPTNVFANFRLREGHSLV